MALLLRRVDGKSVGKPIDHALVFGAGIIGLQLLHGGDAVLDLLAIGCILSVMKIPYSIIRQNAL